jgi:arsenate reductase
VRRIAALVSVLMASPAIAAAQGDSGTVVFVCEHGTVKSVIALAHFDRLARERGLPFRASSRGTAPDPRLPDFMRRSLRAEGFDVDAFVPARFDSTALAGAIQVVSFDVPSLPATTVPLQQWDRLPSVTADYARGSSAIKARVEALVDSLVKARRLRR